MKQNLSKKLSKPTLIILSVVLIMTLNFASASEMIPEYPPNATKMRSLSQEQALKINTVLADDHEVVQSKSSQKVIDSSDLAGMNNLKLSVNPSPRKAQKLIGQYDIYSSGLSSIDVLEIVSVDTSVPHSIYFRYNIYNNGILQVYDEIGLIHGGMIFFHSPLGTLTKTYYLHSTFTKSSVNLYGIHNIFEGLLQCDELPPIGYYGGKCFLQLPQDVVRNAYYSVILVKR